MNDRFREALMAVRATELGRLLTVRLQPEPTETELHRSVGGTGVVHPLEVGEQAGSGRMPIEPCPRL